MAHHNFLQAGGNWKGRSGDKKSLTGGNFTTSSTMVLKITYRSLICRHAKFKCARIL